MRRFLLLFLMISTTLSLFAQKNLNEEEEIQTIFGDGQLASGGYGGPEIKYTQFLGEDALMVGGRGGWIINHVFSIGGAGYGLVTSHQVPDYHDSSYYFVTQRERPYYLRTGWGGLFLQYTYSSNSIIHFTIYSLIGAGGATCTPSYREMEEDEDNLDMIPDYGGSGFFIFEPGIGIELNVFKFFRIELGGSYRIIGGLEMPENPKTNKPYVDKSDFGTYSVNLAFKFGNF